MVHPVRLTRPPKDARLFCLPATACHQIAVAPYRQGVAPSSYVEDEILGYLLMAGQWKGVLNSPFEMFIALLED